MVGIPVCRSRRFRAGPLRERLARNTIRLELYDNRSDPTQDTSERFEYKFTNNFTGWKSFSVPWSSFTRRSWQPAGAPNDGLTLTEIYGFNFSPTRGTGSFQVDQIQLEL